MIYHKTLAFQRGLQNFFDKKTDKTGDELAITSLRVVVGVPHLLLHEVFGIDLGKTVLLVHNKCFVVVVWKYNED